MPLLNTVAFYPKDVTAFNEISEIVPNHDKKTYDAFKVFTSSVKVAPHIFNSVIFFTITLLLPLIAKLMTSLLKHIRKAAQVSTDFFFLKIWRKYSSTVVLRSTFPSKRGEKMRGKLDKETRLLHQRSCETLSPWILTTYDNSTLYSSFVSFIQCGYKSKLFFFFVFLFS